MKTIGLIGGMSWESSQTYYRLINRKVRDELGGLHSAKLVLYSVDFAEIEALEVRIPMSGFTTPQKYTRSRRFTMPWRKLADSRGAAHQPGRAFGHHTLRKSFVA